MNRRTLLYRLHGQGCHTHRLKGSRAAYYDIDKASLKEEASSFPVGFSDLLVRQFLNKLFFLLQTGRLLLEVNDVFEILRQVVAAEKLAYLPMMFV